MSYALLRFVALKILHINDIFIKEVTGLENIPNDDGAILAMNHMSYLDTVLMTLLIAEKCNRKLRNLGKTELFRTAIGRWFHNTVGTIPINRDATGEIALKNALDLLKKKELIGIYPEGGRSRDGKLRQGKTGMVRLALWSKKKIIPVGIRGTYELWPHQKKIPTFKKIVTIHIGRPLRLEAYYKKPITKTLLRTLTDKVMKEIGKLANLEYPY